MLFSYFRYQSEEYLCVINRSRVYPIHVLYSLLSSGSCIPSRFQNPPQSLVLKEGQASSVLDSTMASAPGPSLYGDRPMTSRPPTAADNSEHMLLDPNQVHQGHYTLITVLHVLLFLPVKEHVPLHLSMCCSCLVVCLFLIFKC